MGAYQDQQRKLFDDIEKSGFADPSSSTLVSLDNSVDKRMCLTGIVFPPEDILKVLNSEVIEPLKSADPRHYYYPEKSLHFTIKNLKVVEYPIPYTDDDLIKAKSVFEEVIPRHKVFSFHAQGLFHLPVSISIRGYTNESLKNIILDFDQVLEKAGIPDNKKYASPEVFFGNMNVCRYTTEPNEQFKKQLKKLKDIDIGTFEVKTVSLITTNLVCHPDKTTIIGEYTLPE
ncbi:hypothetical protein ACFL0L_03200 [Patescibacteria group bacterium]